MTSTTVRSIRVIAFVVSVLAVSQLSAAEDTGNVNEKKSPASDGRDKGAPAAVDYPNNELNIISLKKLIKKDAVDQIPQAEASMIQKLSETKDVDSVQNRNRVLYYIRNGLILISIHMAFWILLMYAYPRSRQIRSVFFDNLWMHRIIGLGYVEPVLTHVPFFRRLLLTPFLDDLVEGAALKYFSDKEYYKESEVLNHESDKVERLVDVLKQLRGQVVLVGASGIGKSMFLRYLLHSTRDRIRVFLPAAKCTKGVIPAIQSMLKGPAKNRHFLESISRCGDIDIYIDSLDEVSPNTRKSIVEFAEKSADIILAAEHMEGQAPEKAEVLMMRPLSREQIEAFLHIRWETVKEQATLYENEYKTKCKEYLDKEFRNTQPEGVYGVEQSILSNPMDLSIVAQMLASGIRPDLMGLLQQYFETMAADYNNKNPDKFPFSRFSMHVYRMRRDNRENTEASEFSGVLEHMEKHQMMIKHKENDKDVWSFRHEKIMDFFVVPQFLGPDNSKRKKHMGDAGFKGVYSLMANLMPLKDAESLRIQLIEYAAKTGDHTVSDAFVCTLMKRKRYCSIGTEESALGKEAEKNIIDDVLCKTHMMQTNSHVEIAKFLYARWESVKKQSTMSKEEYRTKCMEYLDKMLSTAQNAEIRYATQIILSNAANVTIVAQLIASGVCPELSSLCRQIQQYRAGELQV